MNSWTLLVCSLVVLSSCAPDAAPQQGKREQLAGPAETRPARKPAAPSDNSKVIQQKIDEITDRLEYIQRYIGDSSGGVNESKR
jgi:hypothetical protein